MPVDKEFLAAMYGQDDEPEAQTGPSQGVAPGMPPRGIISLPALSQIVRTQAQQIAGLTAALAARERDVRRLQSRIHAIQIHLNTVGKAVNGLDKEMDGKVDRRDW